MELLRRVCPGLGDEGSKDDHLVVVVVRGGWGEGGPGAPPQGPTPPTPAPAAAIVSPYTDEPKSLVAAAAGGLAADGQLPPQQPPHGGAVSIQFSHMKI